MRFFTKLAYKIKQPKLRQICYATHIKRETPQELAMGGDEIYEITSDSPSKIGKELEINRLSKKLNEKNIYFLKFNYSEKKGQGLPALLIEEKQLFKLKK
ncbi:MAG TPA: hypothetical protein VLH77_06415 [Gammaproteobacteria bacterium]|nr:hypothetical protein [Gammaproteobacteria bacterium]